MTWASPCSIRTFKPVCKCLPMQTCDVRLFAMLSQDSSSRRRISKAPTLHPVLDNTAACRCARGGFRRMH